MKIIDIITLKTVFESDECLSDFLKNLETLAADHFMVSKDFRALIHFNAQEKGNYQRLIDRTTPGASPFNLFLTYNKIQCAFGSFLVVGV